MKFHLGCGKQYMPHAVNIDRYDLTVADVKADAGFLPLQSECTEAVSSHHLLEHLSYTEAVYGLAECFRILKPNGVIEIETPDPEQSFRAFLESKEDRQKARVLSWIFGEEQSGQGHRALFPRELLSKMVTEAGFGQLEFCKPRTHLRRWGIRLVALKEDSNTASTVLSQLRPVIAFTVVNEATPPEALELERTLWNPLRQCIAGELKPDVVQAYLFRAAVIAPRVIVEMAKRCRTDRSLSDLFGDIDFCKLGQAARALVEAEVCTVLRKAFLELCSGINQAADGYEHLMNGACLVAEKWADAPPENPNRALLDGLCEFEVGLQPHRDDQFLGDYDVASGKTLVEGRKPVWPKHTLFTREHLAERARWFRDLGIRCFSLGKHAIARRLFRLAINSKVEGLYSVWNMARLQSVLGHTANAEAFYRATLDFPMPPALGKRIRLELEESSAERASSPGPVPVGEGLDRVDGLMTADSGSDS